MKKPPGMKHGESYALMKYQNDKAGRVEWLWNSRDGVTPFVISCDKTSVASHADWHEDVFVPNFVPPVGMRIFVDGKPSIHGGFEPSVVTVDAALQCKFAELAEKTPWQFVEGRMLRKEPVR